MEVRSGRQPRKDISREARKLKQDCSFVLGNGRRVKFLEDSWCGEGTLCELFPSLYVLARTKGAMVAEV